ncbi:hypothetical protein DPEC_G00175710 [Dallia pectoralis]|uniref:Uncharacterized protein n=1 Tax=Dallia pectoralis TaxID=75939 RepID=A0ACC2GEM6_DALPE|nr:hypothetical protein DPEC_G00175710 [Dallia pectoralis]
MSQSAVIYQGSRAARLSGGVVEKEREPISEANGATDIKVQQRLSECRGRLLKVSGRSDELQHEALASREYEETRRGNTETECNGSLPNQRQKRPVPTPTLKIYPQSLTCGEEGSTEEDTMHL